MLDAKEGEGITLETITKKKQGKKKLNNIGAFGSIANIPKNIRNPKIVACTDGVGTKIEIANILNKYDTIGIDLVAMNVNDLIVQGAKPLFFLRHLLVSQQKKNHGRSVPILSSQSHNGDLQNFANLLSKLKNKNTPV